MGGGPTAFGQDLTKGFDQLKQQSGQGKQQGMMLPEFKYTPQKGLQVNFGNDMLSQLMSGLQQHTSSPQQMAPVVNPTQQMLQRQAQQPNILAQNLPVSSPMGYPQG